MANLKTALPAVVKVVKGGWDNVQSLNIKTNSSVSLPIWSCDLGADGNGRWAGLVRAESEASESEDDGAQDASDAEQVAKTKGKKRATESDEVPEETQPKKKMKTSKASVSKQSSASPKERKKQKQAASGVNAPAPSSDKVSSAAKRQPKAESSLSSQPTSGASKEKKARALATDFFDDAHETHSVAQAALTPATVATDLPEEIAAGRSEKVQVEEERAKVPLVEVDGAIEGTTKARKPRHKKNKAVVQNETSTPAMHAEQRSSTETPTIADIANAGGAAENEQKKKKKKKKPEGQPASADAAVVASAAEVPSAAQPAATVSIDEVKLKRGASSGLERKKERLVKAAKRSAKDALIGKKGL